MTLFFILLGVVTLWFLVGAISTYIGCKLDTELETIEKGVCLLDFLGASSFGPIVTGYVFFTMVIPRLKVYLVETSGLRKCYIIPPREATDKDRELARKFPPYKPEEY